MRIRCLLSLAAFLLLPVSQVAAAEAASLPEKRHVRLQLKWTHQFQFAGYYAALKKGFYSEAGIEVEIVEGRPDVSPSTPVLNGQAQFGISNSSLVIERSQGKPVVALAAIFQHSPYVLLTRQGPDLQSIHDLPGKKLMLEEHADELLTYLHYERIPKESLVTVRHTGRVEDVAAGLADALTAYSTLEPYLMRQRGIPYHIFNPRSSGIDFYGDLLFTTEDMIKRDPHLVSAFREASIRGWRYALDHPQEIIDLILSDYAPGLDRGLLEFEAKETRPLIVPDIVDVGYMYEGRWRNIADGFAAAGLMPLDFSLKGFIYLSDAKLDMSLYYKTLAGAGAIILIGGIILLRFQMLNSHLKREIEMRTRLEEELQALATTDSLTGICNRRRFFETGEQETSLMRRFKDEMALLMMDIDHFKLINDRFGHAAGDEVLRRFTACCQEAIRDVDTLARIGGEEFAIILPKAGREQALEVAERLRQSVATMQICAPDGSDITLTVSIGVAVLASEDDTLTQMLERADKALYAAKEAGRNRVCV